MTTTVFLFFMPNKETSSVSHVKKPTWLKVPFPGGERYSWIKNSSQKFNLSTVCQEANCPNIGECWNSGTATFMLLGDICTRGCRFCAVKTAKKPPLPDPDEPAKLANTIQQMKLDYVVLTTVDRDDMPDQGAEHIAACIQSIQQANPDLLIEILMPDFQGQVELVQKVINAQPAVLAHNLETVRSWTPKVRDPRATYDQSLKVLKYLKDNSIKGFTKSSLMLGIGESHEETLEAMQDLREVGVDFLTLGQYLQPSRKHIKLEKYLSPDYFNELKVIGEEMGFEYVASAPLVRSSYKAAEFFIARKIREAA